MSSTEFIKAYMKREGITYEEIGKKIGISKTGVWQTLNGRKGRKRDGDDREPNFDTVDMICEAIGLKITITKTGEMNPEELLKSPAIAQMSFDAVKDILEAGGFELKIEE